MNKIGVIGIGNVMTTVAHILLMQYDYTELADADIIVTAFGDIEATNRTGDRFAELPINKKNAREVGEKIKDSDSTGSSLIFPTHVMLF